MEQHEQRARFNLVGLRDATDCLGEGGQLARELRADAAVGKEGGPFPDHAVKEVDDGAAVEFGAGLVQESGSAVAPFDVPAVEGGLVILEEILFGDGLVRIVQNIFLFFQKS